VNKRVSFFYDDIYQPLSKWLREIYITSNEISYHVFIENKFSRPDDQLNEFITTNASLKHNTKISNLKNKRFFIVSLKNA